MGQVQIKEFRRRLVHGDFGTYEEFMEGWLAENPEAKRLAFRPFGGWNYSYDESWMRTASFSQWIFATAATLGVDWREAAIVLGGTLYYTENYKKYGVRLFKENTDGVGSGASWGYNLQAGYLAYHVLFKRNKRWLVWLVLGGGVVADVYAWLNDAGTEELDTTNHYAHFEGFVVGLAAAYLLDFVFKKKKAVL